MVCIASVGVAPLMRGKVGWIVSSVRLMADGEVAGNSRPVAQPHQCVTTHNFSFLLTSPSAVKILSSAIHQQALHLLTRSQLEISSPAETPPLALAAQYKVFRMATCNLDSFCKSFNCYILSLFAEAARLSATASDLPSQLRVMKLKEMSYKAKLTLDK